MAIDGGMKRIVKLACIVLVSGAFVGSAIGEVPESLPAAATVFVQDNCVHCHGAETKQGGLDLEALSFGLSDTSIFGRWVEIHDRVRDAEMPPPDDAGLTQAERQAFLESIAPPMAAADRERIARHGRAKLRRLNRLEYENTLRAVLDAPWLQVADMLPEDGVAHLFNKVGDRLDVSHVQITRYLAAADHAIRAAVHAAAHQTTTNKYYAREEPVMQHYLRYRFGQTAATRAVIPLIGTTPQPDVVRGILPVTVGDSDPGLREQEAFGVVCGTYTATLKYDFTRMRVPTDGMYRLRMKSYTFLAGPNGRSGGDDHGLTGGTAAWWRPSRTEAFPGTRSEPITLYALADSGDSRWLTTFDSFPEPAVIEREVALKTGEAIRPDAGRLVRTRPGWSGNPNATQAGVSGFAMNWLEVTGPLHEEWPPASYEAVFGDLPFEVAEDGSVRAVSEHPDDDARPLLLDVLKKAYRRPLRDETEVEPFFAVYREAIALGEQFTDAMIAAFSAILSSPDFLYFESPAGPLDRSALASRLSYFLWNGPPDAKLNVGLTCNSVKTESQDRAAGVAAYNEPLRVHTDRLLDDPRSGHFIDSFLDYWLDLRDINANAPDAELYPDYYIDDLLTESSIRETRMFFRKLIENDLPVRNLVDSDFAFVNERLADHYGLPTLEGVEPRRVALPEKSPRGGLLTQAQHIASYSQWNNDIPGGTRSVGDGADHGA